MEKLYTQIDAMLGSLDFDRIWPGFARCRFALYDGERVCLGGSFLPYDRRFLGNTAIEYEGGYIAIWRVDNPAGEDPQALAAHMVHEMFHAHQRQERDVRYPDNLRLLDYPADVANYSRKHAENKLLAAAARETDLRQRRALFERFLRARLARAEGLGALIRQEYLTETQEGMAEHAGCEALRFFAPEKHARRIDGFCNRLCTLDSGFFDIRRQLYESGALVAWLARSLGFPVEHAIGKTEKTLFEMVAEGYTAVPVGLDGQDSAAMQAAWGAYSDEKQAMFAACLAACQESVEGPFTICGYDPMNTHRLGDQLLCTHFIMLRGGGDPLFVQGPLVLTMEPLSYSTVLSYQK